MEITARKVRWALLAMAVALVVVIVGFASYAHYQARHLLLGLPHKLGVDIKQETNGFTYSQSVGGRTVFTVHASKEIQRTNGRITLHDVGITLYGRTAGSADRIHGNDFEYDPAQGVLTAQGEVYLDLEAPAGTLPAQSNADPGDRMVHVKTSGLTFLEKERTANTDQPIEFSAPGLTGRAVGASYDSAGGLVVLKGAVEMNGLRGGRPLTLTASRAEIDRNSNMVRLTASVAAQTTQSGVERLSAEQALVQLTPDGAARRLDAQGHVLLTRDSGGTLSCDRLTAEFASDGPHQSMLQRAQLRGDVHFRQQAEGGAQQGTTAGLDVLFDGAGRAERADLGGGVSLQSRRGDSLRTLLATRARLVLRGAANGRSLLDSADVFGDSGSAALVQLVSPNPKQRGNLSTRMMGEHLRARFDASGKTTELQTIVGEGQTGLEQTATDLHGTKLSQESITGDTLSAAFRRDTDGRTALVHAEQQGHVMAMRQVAAHVVTGRMFAAEMERASAASALVDEASNRVQLVGDVKIADASGELFANRVSINRTSGQALADGSVRVSYMQPGSHGDPLHIAAARAESDKASGLTRFFGAAGGRGGSASGRATQARLWQGGSQVEAAEIDFDRAQRRLTAKGDGGLVKAVLSSAGGQASSGLIRVASHELSYTDATRQIDLTGAVKLIQAENRLQSANATIFLAQSDKVHSPKPDAESGSSGLMGSQVERIVASGGVQLEQPGRKANGNILVYTAADQSYVLTGTRTAPPRLMDESRGTITGASLRFRGGDDSVEILGSKGQRVESQTRLKTTPKR